MNTNEPQNNTELSATQKRTELSIHRTMLAQQRTMLAHKRTMLAWCKSALGIQAFAIAIDKFALTEHSTLSAGVLTLLVFVGISTLLTVELMSFNKRMAELDTSEKKKHFHPEALIAMTVIFISGCYIALESFLLK
ncbi:MAG: DUF202 domain-containing protein [Desulfovibrio sp.]